MASQKLNVVDDRLANFSCDNTCAHSMPNIDESDPGFWDNEVTDLESNMFVRTYINATNSRDRFILDSDNFNSKQLTDITGIKKLWTGNHPNGFRLTPSEIREERIVQGNCLQLSWRGSGYRSLLFGGTDIPSDLHRPTNIARWVKPIGLQFDWNSYIHDNIQSVFSINNLMFIYKKRHKSEYYFVPLVRSEKYLGRENHIGYNLVSEHNTMFDRQGTFATCLSSHEAQQVANEDMLCIGMIMNFWGSGHATMDISNFKLLLSDPSTQKSNSLLILPPAMSLLKREQLLSTPIL